MLTFTYVSGTINWGNPSANVSAQGAHSVAYANFPAPTLLPFSPIGTFADSSGDTIGLPFQIANGHASVAANHSPQQIQLGVNDNYYADNSGVRTIDVQVPGPASLAVPDVGLLTTFLLRRHTPLG